MNRLTPPFLKTLDTHLLLHSPIVWMSRIHFVLWQCFLLWILSALFGLVLPIDLKRHIEYELWYFLFTVIALVIFCFWVYRFVIFNKEKNYGKRNVFDALKNLVLVFSSVLCFVVIPWPFEIVYQARIAATYTDQEIVEDINTMNVSSLYLAKSPNVYFQWYDSTTQAQYFTLKKLNNYNVAQYTPYIIFPDSDKVPGLLSESRIKKSYDPYSSVETIGKKLTELKETALKYNTEFNEDPLELARRFSDLVKKDQLAVNDFYSYDAYQNELHMVFTNVCEAKFKPLFIFKSEFLWFIFYFVLAITNLLLLFKMTYWRQFLITIVVMLLYPLITFIFSQLIPGYGGFRSNEMYLVLLLLPLLFCIATVFISLRASRFEPFFNICNQLIYINLIYLPLLIVVTLHDCTEIFHNHEYYSYENAATYSAIAVEAPAVNPGAGFAYQQQLDAQYSMYWSDEYRRWISICKYTGIILFFAAMTFFKQLFIRQIALPKKT